MLTLEVLICTIDDGIENIIRHILPPTKRVSYLISWQQTKSFEGKKYIELESRPDIRIIPSPGKGLSQNRNLAFTHAQGDILLISDDDVTYQNKYYENILTSFEKHPEIDIITFQAIDEEGKYLKKYPKEPFLYGCHPKYTYISSIEIAVRKKSKIPAFDPRFGIGAEYLNCGEEEVFIHQAFLKGAKILYLPIIVAQTSKNTTGSRFLESVKVRRTKGAVLYIIHGYWGAILRCLKFALLLKSKNKISIFKDMYDGIRYVKNK